MRARDRIAVVCCGATLVFAALAFGGAERWAALGATAGTFLSAIPYINSRRRLDSWSPVLVLIGIAITLTALQLVPLPSSVAGLVASEKLQLVNDHAVAWSLEAPKFVMATYDPPATLVELAKLCGYAAFAFSALRIANHRVGRKLLGAVLVSAAIAVSIAALIHAALGATSVYGIVDSPTQGGLVSPIINANHLASLMSMAVPVAIGLGLSSIGAGRLLWFGAALMSAAFTFLSGSRGGAIGLVIGVVVAFALWFMQRRQDDQSQRRTVHTWIPLVVIGGCSVVLLVALTSGPLISELLATRASELGGADSKLAVWQKAAHMLEANPILGTGRGAFEQAFTRWANVSNVTYKYAENSYVQSAVDWGVLGALAVGIAMFLLVRTATRRWRESPLEAGVLGALACLAVHDLMDFSLELPVIAMAATLLFSIMLAPTLSAARRGDHAVAISRRTQGVRVLGLALGVMICVVAATPLGQDAHAMNGEIAGTAAERLDEALIATERHPADYLLFGRAAQTLMEMQDPRAAPVLNRALYLNPHHAGLHLIAASLLFNSHHEGQAQGELSRALRDSPDRMRSGIIKTIVEAFPQPDQAALALPVSRALAPEIVRLLTELHHESIVVSYAGRLVLLFPDDPVVQLIGARAALATGNADIALTMGRQAFRLRGDADAAVVFGEALALAGSPAQGIQEMRDALTAGAIRATSDRIRLLTAIVDLELSTNAFPQAAKTLDQLMELATDRETQIGVFRRRAVLHENTGEANQAIWDREQAHKLEFGDGP